MERMPCFQTRAVAANEAAGLGARNRLSRPLRRRRNARGCVRPSIIACGRFARGSS